LNSGQAVQHALKRTLGRRIPPEQPLDPLVTLLKLGHDRVGLEGLKSCTDCLQDPLPPTEIPPPSRRGYASVVERGLDRLGPGVKQGPTDGQRHVPPKGQLIGALVPVGARRVAGRKDCIPGTASLRRRLKEVRWGERRSVLVVHPHQRRIERVPGIREGGLNAPERADRLVRQKNQPDVFVPTIGVGGVLCTSRRRYDLYPTAFLRLRLTPLLDLSDGLLDRAALLRGLHLCRHVFGSHEPVDVGPGDGPLCLLLLRHEGTLLISLQVSSDTAVRREGQPLCRHERGRATGKSKEPSSEVRRPRTVGLHPVAPVESIERGRSHAPEPSGP